MEKCKQWPVGDEQEELSKGTIQLQGEAVREGAKRIGDSLWGVIPKAQES